MAFCGEAVAMRIIIGRHGLDLWRASTYVMNQLTDMRRFSAQRVGRGQTNVLIRPLDQ